MATAVLVGVSAFSAAGGVAAGASAVAWGVAAAAGMAMLEQAMQPDLDTTQQPVSLGSQGQAIDKTSMQREAELGKLKLGEDDAAEGRKKGKAAFKIELDEQQKAEGAEAPAQGVQVQSPEQQGVQI